MILQKSFFILKTPPELPQATRTIFFEARKSYDFLASQNLLSFQYRRYFLNKKATLFTEKQVIFPTPWKLSRFSKCSILNLSQSIAEITGTLKFSNESFKESRHAVA